MIALTLMVVLGEICIFCARSIVFPIGHYSLLNRPEEACGNQNLESGPVSSEA